ncbi:MAG: polysaccharide deacetylase family protein [Methanomassiliicoccales archaeon]|nr:MAG: polysaccharide deacetylase family protein [Methanomassiliicoccales archaeon]
MLDKKQIDYTMNTLFSTLGIHPNIPISYGYDVKKNGVNILCSSKIKDLPDSMGRKNFLIPPNFRMLESKTPVLYNNLSLDFGEPLFRYKNGETAVVYDSKKNVIYIGFDLAASAFYFLWLKEEEDFINTDVHDRFLAHNGNLSSRFAGQPVVNSYLHILFDSVRYMHDKLYLPLVQKWYWPSNRDFAVCLTHDIDFLEPGILYHLLLPFKCLYKLDFKRAVCALKRTWPLICGRAINPWDYIKIAESEKASGFRSTFFFTAGGRSRHDYPYDINKMKGAFLGLKNAGFEIGLHGSFNSYDNTVMLMNEKRKLEKVVGKITGARQHYLRFDRDTWESQEKANFGYDSTLCYADTVGFRGGLAHPFFPYNRDTGERMKILEIPLTVMDKTLSEYENKNAEEAWDAIGKIIKNIERYNGMMTLLWHNELFDDNRFPGWEALYKKILAYLKNTNAWVVKAEDVHTWWRGRQNLLCENISKKDGGQEVVYRAKSDVENMTLRIYNLREGGCVIKCKGSVDIIKDDTFSINIDRIEKGEIVRLEMT